MGSSSGGIICFGVLFPEGFVFPWNENEFDDNIEKWWLFTIKGFKHSFEIYNKQSNRLSGVTEEDVSRYYKERRDFLKDNPLPIELENCADYYDFNRYVLSVPGIRISCSGFLPTDFNPSELTVQRNKVEDLFFFIDTYCKPEDHKVPIEARWYLCSNYG